MTLEMIAWGLVGVLLTISGASISALVVVWSRRVESVEKSQIDQALLIGRIQGNIETEAMHSATLIKSLEDRMQEFIDWKHNPDGGAGTAVMYINWLMKEKPWEKP
jgi:hypothetical protein